MNREELFASIVAARPGRDDIVYLERRGDCYDWRVVPLDTLDALDTHDDADVPSPQSNPDVWMSFSATWPQSPERTRAFFDDLLAELESMATPADRCRWPLDEPWPHSH